MSRRAAGSTTVVGVDLACARWRDVGFAVLVEGPTGRIAVETSTAADLGLSGRPEAAALADALDGLGRDVGARHLLIDGPGGWKRGDAHDRLTRVAERLARTPGKAGLPGITWPRTFLRFTEFSIALFDALAARGWQRLVAPERLVGTRGRFALETFPTATWRALGLVPLAGKQRADAAAVRAATRRLCGVVPLALPRAIGHDELQAVVAGLPGLAIAAGRRDQWAALGERLVREDGSWREGWVVLPAPRTG